MLKATAEGYGWKVLAESLLPDEKQDIGFVAGAIPHCLEVLGEGPTAC